MWINYNTNILNIFRFYIWCTITEYNDNKCKKRANASHSCRSSCILYLWNVSEYGWLKIVEILIWGPVWFCLKGILYVTRERESPRLFQILTTNWRHSKLVLKRRQQKCGKTGASWSASSITAVHGKHLSS